MSKESLGSGRWKALSAVPPFSAMRGETTSSAANASSMSSNRTVVSTNLGS